jgi:6-phosphogluconolactonase (cycloisomerase 2 family)
MLSTDHFFRLLRGAACAAWVCSGLPARAQNPLDLELVAGGQLGAPAIFAVGGQDPAAPLAKLLVLDVSGLGSGIPIPPLGTLLLPLTPLALTIPGGTGNGYALPISAAPGLAGLAVFAQALGPVAGQPFGTLGFSDLETFTLSDTTPVARLVFSLAALDAGLFVSVFDSQNRRLAPCSYAPLSTLPGALCTSPDGRFAYVAEPTSGLLRGFLATPVCGGLQTIGSSVIDAGTSVLAVDPLMRFLFAASPQSDRLLTIRLDQVSGAPSPSGIGSAPALTDPLALWVSEKGQHLYALSGVLGELRRYGINGSSGDLTLQQSVPVPVGSAELLVNPGGGLVAVLAPFTGTLQVFSRDLASGQLVPQSSGVQSLGFSSGGAALDDAAGAGLLHVSDPLGNAIRSFSILLGSGALVPTSPASLSLPTAPGRLLLDAGGGVLFASLPAQAELQTLPLGPNRLPGAGPSLRSRGAIQSLASARGLKSLVPRSRTVVLASEATAELRVFQFSPSDGKLIPTGGGVNPTGPGPVGVAIAPDNALVVSADLGGSSATSFPLDSAASQLGAGQTQLAAAPFDLTFEPSGRFVYVSNSGNSTVQTFLRQGTQLVPSASFHLPVGSIPRGLAIDPAGRCLYVALSLSNEVAALRINPSNGNLTLIALLPLSGGPFDVCMHPSGRFLYVSLSSLNRIKGYAIDAFDGNLTQLSTNTNSTGALPTVLTTDPFGQRLFCANSNGDNISIFNIDAATGLLTTAMGSPLAVLDDPRGLAVDASGQVLLVANRAVDVVQAFQVPAGNLPLTGLSLSATGGDSPRGLALDLLWE